MRPVIALLAAALLVALVPAGASAAATCPSSDLRYPFTQGGPNDFGVFKLKATGGSCATAHRVAKTWMTRFERALQKGKVKLPKNVSGFAFKTLPATAAQEYNERGTKGGATVSFRYRVPNG